MDDDELQRWIDEWSAQYPSAYDDSLAALEGIESLGHDDAEMLYRWKFRGLWPQRKINQMRAVPEADIRGLTKRAFQCEDELGALLILSLVPGLSAAGGSAVLAAQQPGRYTVMDVRALASLIALGRWDQERQGTEASALMWPEYLAVCRDIAAVTGRSLRAVDRALWKANGAAAKGVKRVEAPSADGNRARVVNAVCETWTSEIRSRASTIQQDFRPSPETTRRPILGSTRTLPRRDRLVPPP